MRKDMPKLITDRPRTAGGRRRAKPTIRQVDIESADDLEVGPSHSAMRDRDEDRKSQRDHLSPLFRFLQSRIGKPWDAVWSEICRNADLRSTLGDHLRQHVLGYVQLDIADVNKNYRNLYVDPNGTLKCRPYKRHRWPKERANVFLVDGKTYHQHDGIWYQVKMKTADDPPVPEGESIVDAFLGHVRPQALSKFQFARWRKLHDKYHADDKMVKFCSWKRSANKKEIKSILVATKKEKANE